MSEVQRAPDGRVYVPAGYRWARAARAHRPYPVEALAVPLGIPVDDDRLTARLVLALGFNRTTVRRYRSIGGLTEAQAEAWAVRAGLHPARVWSNWGEGEPESMEAPAPAWLKAS